MSAGHNDPKLLYSVGFVNAYHIQDGKETPVGDIGPQTLSLIMVPTSSPFSDLSSTEPTSAAPEEDFYLHLQLPDIELPLPATTQVYHQPPQSYLIPRWDLGTDVGAFLRIDFPKIGSESGMVSQEDIDTFETILAQCTAFLERARPPLPTRDTTGSTGGIISKTNEHGRIVLVDEEDGSVVGELSQGFELVESSDVKPGSKQPVEFSMPGEGEGNMINVQNASDVYLKMTQHPAYKDSGLVRNAALASRLIMTSSDWIADRMSTGADNFTAKTKPNPKPLTFSPTTQEHVRRLNKFTGGAVDLSARTVGTVTKRAQNIGAHLTGKGAKPKTSNEASYKPGLLNKSMMAFSTVADGVDYASRHLLASGSSAATQVVGHRYGEDAKGVAGHLAGGVKNVGLVYIDAAGVSRRAVIKSVAKGMVVGRAPDGKNLVVGEGNGGGLPLSTMPDGPAVTQSVSNPDSTQQQVGFGNAALQSEKLPGPGKPLGS